MIVNYQDFPIFSSNFKILEILKFFHQFIKENHQFIKFIKFHKIFFLDLVPPSKKLQMQTQIRTKTEKMTRIFFIERWYKSYTWLTIGWHLVDNCTSVTTWHFWHSSKARGFHAVWVFPGAVTKYFLMSTAIIGQSNQYYFVRMDENTWWRN